MMSFYKYELVCWKYVYTLDEKYLLQDNHEMNVSRLISQSQSFPNVIIATGCLAAARREGDRQAAHTHPQAGGQLPARLLGGTRNNVKTNKW